MKIFFLFPVISLITPSNYPDLKFSSIFPADTTTIIHLLDGNIAEWPAENFATDKATNIRYAVDNDAQNLFLAINVSGKNEQQKIMQQGMRLFVDAKGKKRENRGVDFPLGTENVSDVGNMKLFGFDNAEAAPQNVKTDGTINIAMGWDSSYALNIEYTIPLKMFEGSITELNNKKVSIGWKINEAVNTTPPPIVTSRIVGVRVTSNTPTPNRNTAPTPRTDALQSNSNKAQSIWTTYTIIL